ncbi:O-antigen polymerase protein [Azotobacter chroococcum NCIMB 8003]|uniref:O-antigen polymerase protein n=1 Tax=Azotobacter chroococcum NCIMB 8003 TaxID=1328314 RepID=A0A0C4WJW5_9GAMM|nr:O-antigen polymerase protein [Azotobacter chroococcum NCIMB 8003]
MISTQYLSVLSRFAQVWPYWLGTGLFVQLAGLVFNNDGSRYATQVYLLLFVPALFLLLARCFSPDTWRQWPARILLALSAWVLLSGWLNPGAAEDPGHWFKIVGLVLIYVFAVASLVGQPCLFRRLLVAAVAMAALFAWLTLYYQFGVLDKPLDYQQIRFTGRLSELGWKGFADLDHPIVAGLYYGVFAVLATGLLVGLPLRAWQAALLVLGMLGLLAYILLTFSRGAWFATAAGGLVTLLLFPNARSKALLGSGALLLLVALFVFWPEIQHERQVGLSNRDLIWNAWGERFSEFWLMGAGGGADFDFQFPPSFNFSVKHAHSLYLQLWYEYGLVGILLFVALLASLLWKGWQCRAEPLARLGLGLMAFAMVAMVSDIYAIFHRPSPYWVVFWFPVGILLGVRRPSSAGETA